MFAQTQMTAASLDGDRHAAHVVRRVSAGGLRAQHEVSLSKHRQGAAPPLEGPPAKHPEYATDLLAGDVGAFCLVGPPAQPKITPGRFCVDKSGLEEEADCRTTLMIQRVLPSATEAAVQRSLIDAGLGGTYDTIYVPLNRRRTDALGYAFVNFRSAALASEGLRVLAGRQLGALTGGRLCRVAYSKMQDEEFLGHVQDLKAQSAAPRPPKATKRAGAEALAADPQCAAPLVSALAPPPGLAVAPSAIASALAWGVPISL